MSSDRPRRPRRAQPQIKLSRRLQSLFHAGTLASVADKKIKLVHADPNIYLIDDFLTVGETDYLNRICTEHASKFKASFTESTNNEEVVSEERTSTFVHLSKGQDVTARQIEARAANLIGMSPDFVEPLQIVSYRKSQFFNTHHDCGTLLDDGSVQVVYPRRIATLFVYLNTLPPNQGCTEFPEIGLKVTPVRGQALLWCNIDSDGGAERRTVHRACPVPRNLVKYGMNIWFAECSMQELSMAQTRYKIDRKSNFLYEKSAFANADRQTEIFLKETKHGTDNRIQADPGPGPEDCRDGDCKVLQGSAAIVQNGEGEISDDSAQESPHFMDITMEETDDEIDDRRKKGITGSETPRWDLQTDISKTAYESSRKYMSVLEAVKLSMELQYR